MPGKSPFCVLDLLSSFCLVCRAVEVDPLYACCVMSGGFLFILVFKKKDRKLLK